MRLFLAMLAVTAALFGHAPARADQAVPAVPAESAVAVPAAAAADGTAESWIGPMSTGAQEAVIGAAIVGGALTAGVVATGSLATGLTAAGAAMIVYVFLP